MTIKFFFRLFTWIDTFVTENGNAPNEFPRRMTWQNINEGDSTMSHSVSPEAEASRQWRSWWRWWPAWQRASCWSQSYPEPLRLVPVNREHFTKHVFKYILLYWHILYSGYNLAKYILIFWENIQMLSLHHKLSNVSLFHMTKLYRFFFPKWFSNQKPNLDESLMKELIPRRIFLKWFLKTIFYLVQ